MTNNRVAGDGARPFSEETAESHRLPLHGVKVISLAEQYPGPYASMLLADMGADVVMVERPGSGDPARKFPVFFEAINRNKRSVALDLKSDAGRSAFLQLVANADIVIEGFRPGVCQRLSVHYDAVRELNPAIIYLSISGFGQEGPWRLQPGHDLSYQSLAGFLHDHPVQKSDGDGSLVSPVGDLATGTFAVIAALTGLLNRQQTGRGSYVDLAITDCVAAFMTANLFSAANGLKSTGIPPREPAYGLFRTSDDRYLSLSIAHEDPFWAALCDALGLSQYANLKAAARQAQYTELRDMLSRHFASKTLKEWDDLLMAHNVAFAPVLSPAEVLTHPQMCARNLAVTLEAADGNPTRTHIRAPLGNQTAIRKHAPRLGEDTVAVLRKAGLSQTEIDSLLEAQIAVQAHADLGTQSQP